MNSRVCLESESSTMLWYADELENKFANTETVAALHSGQSARISDLVLALVSRKTPLLCDSVANLAYFVDIPVQEVVESFSHCSSSGNIFFFLFP